MTARYQGIALLPIEMGMIECVCAVTGHGNQGAKHREGDQLSGFGVDLHGRHRVLIQSQVELVAGRWFDRQRREDRHVLPA